MSLCVLGSGSGGNCSVLLHQPSGHRRRVILIDAGLGPRTVQKRLRSRGVDIREVSDILLTHLDSDHFNPGWVNFARQRGRVRLHVHQSHLGAAARSGALFMQSTPFDGPFSLNSDHGPTLTVHPIRNLHDSLGSYAFRFRAEAGTLGFATDLGSVTPGFLDHFAGVDVLAIESNYCPSLQLESPRPDFLKRRIMGGSGHLSNQQSFEAVRAISASGRLRHILLLHLSRQCNSPELVRGLYRSEPELARRLTITCQNEPTDWIDITSVSDPLQSGPALSLFSS